MTFFPKLNGRCGDSPVFSPCFANTVLQWLVLAIVVFSGQFCCFVTFSLSFCRYFQIVAVFLSQSVMIFFLYFLWFLKFSSDALADSLPQLFSYCFQIFFCKRSPEIGRGRLQLSFCFYCWRETLGKAVSFLGFSLGVDYTASWVYFSTKTPCGIFTRARKRQIREETRMVQLCCWYYPRIILDYFLL